jgi:MFS transporter, SHS family, sialic acid transporter
MALSILTYSALTAAAAVAQSPSQLLVLWFLASTGVGGMWPNGVALVSEAWPSLEVRP